MSANVNFNSGALYDTVMKAANQKIEEKLHEKAVTMQNVLHREFRNDLVFSGRGELQKELQNVTVEIIKVSDTEYNLRIDMAGLSSEAKEMLEYYKDNALALS